MKQTVKGNALSLVRKVKLRGVVEKVKKVMPPNVKDEHILKTLQSLSLIEKCGCEQGEVLDCLSCNYISECTANDLDTIIVGNGCATIPCPHCYRGWVEKEIKPKEPLYDD